MAIILLSSPSCSVSSSSASSCVPPASMSLCNSTPLEKAGAAWRRTVLLFSTQPLPSLAPAPSPPPFLRWQPQRRVEHRPSATAAKRGGGLVSSGARRWRKWRRSATTTVVTEAEMLPGARGMSDPRPPTTWGPDPDAGGRRRRSAGTEGGEGGSGGAR